MAGDTMMCVNVTIMDDLTVEGNQSFSVSLQSDVNEPVMLTPVQQAIVVIVDDDSKSIKAFKVEYVHYFWCVPCAL